MKLLSRLASPLEKIKNLSRKKKIVLIIVMLLIVGFGIRNFLVARTKSQPTYETSEATLGTLTTTITGTGTITTGNATSITTGATGTITKVYVNNGDTVNKGDKIAEVSLDEYGLKRQAAAYLSYTNALEAVKTSEADRSTADIQMWNYRQAILDAEDDIDYRNKNPINPKTNEEYTLTEKTVIDKTLDQAKLNFSAAELKYTNANAEIQNASVRVTSALYDYQQVSSTITAPADGVVENSILAVGTTITNSSDSSITISDGTTTTSSNSNNTLTASSQSVGSVRNASGQYKATVNLTEADIPSITSDQKVMMTLDAFPEKTFTGKVLAVDTSGSVSSGVTSYPVKILLDTTDVNIYPNMAVNATIITSIKPDVILVPSTAITTVGEISTVQVMKNGVLKRVTVTIGSANDTETEIVSGLSEGDVVVTSTITEDNSSLKTTSSSTSIFSGLGGNRSSGGSMPAGGPPGGM